MEFTKRPIEINDMTKINVVSDPQFSPNGKGYLFTSTNSNTGDNYTSHLFYQELGKEEIKQWTDNHPGITHPRFSPDGKKLVFQSSKSGLAQIWLLDIHSKEEKQLTTFQYGANNPYWSKDGRFIFFSSPLTKNDNILRKSETSECEEQENNKDKRSLIINKLKHKLDGKGFYDGRYTHIISFDTENGVFTQLTEGDRNYTFEDTSPDGKLLLFSANLNANADYEINNDLFTLNLTTGEIVKITKGRGTYDKASFSPSGNKIACFGHDYAYEIATLKSVYIFDIRSNKSRNLSDDWDIQLGDLMIADIRLGNSNTGPVWSIDEEKLFFIASEHGTTALYETNLQGELKILYKDNNHVFHFSYHSQMEEFILGISTPANPGDFYLFSVGKNLHQLTNSNKDLLDEVWLSKPEEISITANDGQRLQGWLLQPYKFEKDKKYPCILEIHGGPHKMYGQTFFHELQLLAGKGYVVIYMNPRGSHGYGQEFVNAIRFDYGGIDYTDIMITVDTAIEKYNFIDVNRLGVTGGSYGGFMTNWIVGHTNRFKAAVTQRSISNWISFYGVSDIGYFFSELELGVEGLDDINKLWDFSPLKYAKNVETPVLILHGEQDLMCPIEQAEQLFITLKHLGKKVEMVRFPEASHEMSRSGPPELRKERLYHICRWFDKYL